MEELLRQLLNRLDVIGEEHEEIYDTDCRERMSEALWYGYLRNQSDYVLPDTYDLFTPEGNLAVKQALGKYIQDANAKAAELGIHDFHARMAAFQNDDVVSDVEGNYYDDFFGEWEPESFDDAGNFIDPT